MSTHHDARLVNIGHKIKVPLSVHSHITGLYNWIIELSKWPPNRISYYSFFILARCKEGLWRLLSNSSAECWKIHHSRLPHNSVKFKENSFLQHVISWWFEPTPPRLNDSRQSIFTAAESEGKCGKVFINGNINISFPTYLAPFTFLHSRQKWELQSDLTSVYYFARKSYSLSLPLSPPLSLSLSLSLSSIST